MIKVKKFIVNPLQENSYVVYDESTQCIIIDAGFYYQEEFVELEEFLKKNKLIPKKLINTHCHFDHLMGVEYARKKYRIPFEAHEKDSFLLDLATEQSKLFGIEMQHVNKIDKFIQEGEQILFGDSQLDIFYVPGHSPGHIALYSEKDQILFSGDVLFYGSIGRSDLEGGDYNLLISSIKSKLMVLPEDTKVYCGHGPETVIGFEKNNNPFLL